MLKTITITFLEVCLKGIQVIGCILLAILGALIVFAIGFGPAFLAYYSMWYLILYIPLVGVVYKYCDD